MSGFTLHSKNGLEWLTAEILPARHLFTTRAGGVSRGVFESLNLGGSRGDEPAAVLENWRRLSEAAGVDLTRAVRVSQVHGAAVHIARAGEQTGPLGPGVCEADAIVTDTPGLPVLVLIADCVPVLLHDPEAGVGAAAHCGWRSATADILGRTVAEMERLGARRERLRAAVGPAIGPCCFETGPEVYAALTDWLGGDGGLARPAAAPGKYLLDLPGANRARLLQLGLRPEHVALRRECTRCNPARYWSHRRCGAARGTQAAILVL